MAGYKCHTFLKKSLTTLLMRKDLLSLYLFKLDMGRDQVVK